MTIVRLGIALLAIGWSLPAAAVVSSGAPAAVLVFPLITVDASTVTDTLVEIANTDAAAVSVRCVLENPSGPGGTAVFTPFTIRLAANQPLGWLAGRGLAAVPGDGGSIPALAGFSGVLRCVAADADGRPAERNVLVGSATIDRGLTSAPYAVDSARYNATGIAAIPGASNGDDQLVLGGPAAEYDACPASLVLPSFLDGAVVDLGAAGVQRTVSTTVALVPCAQNSGATAALDLSLTNEFGQAFVATGSLREQLVAPLSRLDTDNPAQSIFAVGAQGSLTATIHVAPHAGSGGILAVAFPAYAERGNAASAHTAALSPQLDGAVTGPDIIDLAVPTAAPTNTPARTPTAPPTCLGDCDGNGTVTINELITGVNIALGSAPLAMCPSFDPQRTGHVTISDLVAAVNHALSGC